MHIGITYDLKDDYRALGYSEEQVAEFDSKETIDAIEAELVNLGAFVERIGNITALVHRLSQGGRWDLVFNVAEGLSGAARESQVPGLLDAYRIPYTFADAGVLALCLDKGLAKLKVKHAGIATPDFAVVDAPEQIAQLALPLPLFAKPLAEGTSRGISGASLIQSRDDLERTVSALLSRYSQPVLVERYLPGRELTVGVVGTGAQARVLGALEIVLHGKADPGVYSYDNKQLFEDRVSYQLATDAVARECCELALHAYRVLGCRDAGRVDVRLDDAGRPSFIEANPLAGLHPRISDLSILCRELGMPYTQLIAEIVASARVRLPGGARRPSVAAWVTKPSEPAR